MLSATRFFISQNDLKGYNDAQYEAIWSLFVSVKVNKFAYFRPVPEVITMHEPYCNDRESDRTHIAMIENLHTHSSVDA